jgi:hypothetical protein
MGILLAFAPFIAFALVDRLIGPMEGLWAGTLTSAALLARSLFGCGHSLKILEVGTLLLFGGLAVFALFNGPAWSVIGVRLRVDIGLLLIVLASMAVGRPFTTQYAREQVGKEIWSTPAFIRTNYVITGVWALAFAAMVLAEFAIVYVPNVPQRLGVLVIVLALVGAFKFTGWYPDRVRKGSVP